jgi:hypothetical protein
MPSDNTDAALLWNGNHRRAVSSASDRKRTLADQISMELMIHALLGNQVFHPSRPRTSPLPSESGVERGSTPILFSGLAAESPPRSRPSPGIARRRAY